MRRFEEKVAALLAALIEVVKHEEPHMTPAQKATLLANAAAAATAVNQSVSRAAAADTTTSDPDIDNVNASLSGIITAATSIAPATGA